MTTIRNNLNPRFPELLIENGNYFRLKTMTIGYTLPVTLTNSLGLGNVRLDITGINVFTLTPYSGIDPELGYTDGNLQRNVDYAQYPQPRTWAFGDRKSTRLNSSHVAISYAVFCLKKKNRSHT